MPNKSKLQSRSYLCVFRYKKYLNENKNPQFAQPTLADCIATGCDHYPRGHAKQSAITDSIIEDLIVGCSLAMSIVENEHFRRFLSIVDKRYRPICRATVTKQLKEMADKKETILKEELSKAHTVNLTVDIWSDRKMRGYLGITSHFISLQLPTANLGMHAQPPPALKSALLYMKRFKGSHTGQHIADAFDAVVERFKIRNSLNHVITDNAANMKKAFAIQFASPDEAVVEEGGPIDSQLVETEDIIDDPDSWETLPVDEVIVIDDILRSSSKGERLSCFNHTLHLVVFDGLKETKCISLVVSKSCKLSSLLHQSCSFEEAFADQFGTDKGIPASVVTRWNSTLRQLQAVLSLDMCALNAVLEKEGHKNLIFSVREWSQLAEACEMLDPFAEATELTEGEKTVTISSVLPAVLKLERHLQVFSTKAKYCAPMAKALANSLHRRFAGMLHVASPSSSRQPGAQLGKDFASHIYLIAPFFDPKFRLQWIDKDTRLSTTADRELLRNEVLGKTSPNSKLC